MNYRILSNITPSKLTFKEYLRHFPKDIFLYGAGAFGRELFLSLSVYGVKPKGFLDKKITGTLHGIPIFHPEQSVDHNATVIISIVLQEKERTAIIDYLQQLGFTSIIDGQVLRAHYVCFEEGHIYSAKAMQKPLEYFADEESRNIYAHNVYAHLERDYSYAQESQNAEQYFVALPNNTRFASFVDAGAYTGDTFLAAQKLQLPIKNYYAFEPVEKNFVRLEQTLQAFPQISNKLFLAGLSNVNGLATLSIGAAMSSLDEKGESQCQVYSLDEALGTNTSVNFIKMDIEGAELKALYGAEEIIKKHRPNLAICVYHYINHFWDIPNYIQSLNLGYSFYLRAHSSACMENVLYALQEE